MPRGDLEANTEPKRVSRREAIKLAVVGAAAATAFGALSLKEVAPKADELPRGERMIRLWAAAISKPYLDMHEAAWTQVLDGVFGKDKAPFIEPAGSPNAVQGKINRKGRAWLMAAYAHEMGDKNYRFADFKSYETFWGMINANFNNPDSWAADAIKRGWNQKLVDELGSRVDGWAAENKITPCSGRFRPGISLLSITLPGGKTPQLGDSIVEGYGQIALLHLNPGGTFDGSKPGDILNYAVGAVDRAYMRYAIEERFNVRRIDFIAGSDFRRDEWTNKIFEGLAGWADTAGPGVQSGLKMLAEEVDRSGTTFKDGIINFASNALSAGRYPEMWGKIFHEAILSGGFNAFMPFGKDATDYERKKHMGDALGFLQLSALADVCGDGAKAVELRGMGIAMAGENPAERATAYSALKVFSAFASHLKSKRGEFVRVLQGGNGRKPYGALMRDGDIRLKPERQTWVNMMRFEESEREAHFQGVNELNRVWEPLMRESWERYQKLKENR